MTKYELEFLKKYDSGSEFSDKELDHMIQHLMEVDSIKQEPGRWSRLVETIVKIENRFFSIKWDQGLTEMQEDEFYYQPVEVKLEEHEEVIKVKNWIPIKKEGEK